jgi:single-stranded-DNA-specific exonuclease
VFVAKDEPLACICGDDWHPGVIGIVAERIKERFEKPTIIIAMQSDGTGRGSCRSIKGIDIGLGIMDARAAELVIEGGGHEMAAGFSIFREKVEQLRVFLSAKFAPLYKELVANAVSYYEAAISLESITSELVLYLEKVGPFGKGNEQPRFMLSSVSVVSARILKGEHVSCILKDFANKESNKTLKGMCFKGIHTSLGEVLLSSRGPIDLVVTMSLNTWQGREFAEVVIHDAIVRRQNFC